MLVIQVLFFAVSAFAGYYEPSYSGGTQTWDDGSGPVSYNYPSGVLPSGVYAGNGEMLDVSCTGAITTTFTWKPAYTGEPTPKCVIVKEVSEAYISNVAGTWSASSGIANEVSSITTSGPTSYGTKTGTRYTVKQDPGTSFTVTCSPSAVSSTWLVNGAAATIHYIADAQALTIVLAGGADVGHEKWYLMGQKLTGTLSIPFGLQPKTAPPSPYAWSVSGGEAFKTWSATVGNSDPPESLTANPATLTSASLGIHFKVQDDATITCTVQLATPSGAAPTGGLSATTERDCKIKRPDLASFSAYTIETPGATVISGYTGNGVTLVPFAPATPTAIAFQGVYAPPSCPNGQNLGIRWDGLVQTTTASPNIWGGDGGWHFVQTVVGTRFRTNSGVVEACAVNNTDPECDTTYPYEPAPYDPAPNSPGYWAANGTTYVAGDAPSASLNPSTLTRATVNENFKTTLMYRPPNSDSVFVPIKRIKWNWMGVAEKVSGSWTLPDSDSGWTFDGDFPAFPTWDAASLESNLNIWNPV